MSDSFSISLAAPEDLLPIYQLEKECFRSGYDLYALRQFLDLFIGFIFVARDPGGAVVGYAICAPEANNGQRSWLLSLAVKEDCRRQGIGRALTIARMDALREIGANECRMTCPSNNHISINLHQDLGWRLERSAAEYYGPGEERLIFLLNLSR